MRVPFYSFMIRGSTPGRRKGELLIEQFSSLRDVKDKLIPFGFLLRRAWRTPSSATVDLSCYFPMRESASGE